MYRGKDVLIVYDDLSKHAGRLQGDVASAQEAAGKRGLSRRRILPPFETAREGGEAFPMISEADRSRLCL